MRIYNRPLDAILFAQRGHDGSTRAYRAILSSPLGSAKMSENIVHQYYHCPTTGGSPSLDAWMNLDILLQISPGEAPKLNCCGIQAAEIGTPPNFSLSRHDSCKSSDCMNDEHLDSPQRRMGCIGMPKYTSLNIVNLSSPMTHDSPQHTSQSLSIYSGSPRVNMGQCTQPFQWRKLSPAPRGEVTMPGGGQQRRLSLQLISDESIESIEECSLMTALGCSLRRFSVSGPDGVYFTGHLQREAYALDNQINSPTCSIRPTTNENIVLDDMAAMCDSYAAATILNDSENLFRVHFNPAIEEVLQ